MKLSELTLRKLQDFEPREVIGWHNRIHAIYSVTKDKNKIKNIIAKHVLIVKAMKEKGINHNSPIALPINEEIVSVLKEMPAEIVFVPDYFCLSGSAVKKIDPNNIDWVYKSDKKSKSLEILMNKNILGTELTSNFISNSQGSHDDYIPVYDLVLKKKNQLVINKIAKEEKTTVKEEHKKELSKSEISKIISEHAKLHKLSEQATDKEEIKKLIMKHAVIVEKLQKSDIAHSSKLIYKIKTENIEAPKSSIVWLYDEESVVNDIWNTWGKKKLADTNSLNIELRNSGERCICKKYNGDIELYFKDPKTNNDSVFTELKKELEKIDCDFILDCDLSHTKDICSVFDAEYIDENIAELKYSERKQKIVDLFSKYDLSALKIGKSENVTSKEEFENVIENFRKEQGNNYIVAKSDSAYPNSNLTNEWTKIKKSANIICKVIKKSKDKDNKYDYSLGVNTDDGIKEVCQISNSNIDVDVNDNVSLFTDCIDIKYNAKEKNIDINILSPFVEKKVFKNTMSEKDIVRVGIKNYVLKDETNIHNDGVWNVIMPLIMK